MNDDRSFRGVSEPSGLPDLERSGPLPEPRSEAHGGRRIAILAFLAVAILGAAVFWLTRTPAERLNIRQEAGARVNDLLADTPLAGAGSLFAPAPAPPPEKVVRPVTEAGTLAGREVTGTIAAPLDFGPAAGAAGYAMPTSPEALIAARKNDPAEAIASMLGMEAAEEPVTFTQDYLPPAREDSSVRPDYIAGLASWLAARYRPASGALAVTPQMLNQECGGKLAALAPGGRAGLLRYAFHPEMLQGLYRLYIDRFMDDLARAAGGRGLDEAQSRRFHVALGGSAAMLAQAVEGTLKVAGLGERLERIEAAARRIVEANAALAGAVSDLDGKRTAGAETAEESARVGKAAAQCREAEARHSQEQAALANDIRQYAGPGLDGESLLFVAAWIQRRLEGGASARAAIETSASLLRDFAARCARAAEAE